MGRQSTIKQLPEEIRERVDRMVRDESWTIDEVNEAIAELGAAAARSAVGRYVKSAREQMETYRKAQQIAKTWAKSGGEPGDPSWMDAASALCRPGCSPCRFARACRFTAWANMACTCA